jgi:ABC-type multidrug transport system fused ATPase/permease subunit
LFEGTLRANLLLGAPDTSEEQLRHICAVAGLGPLLASLPHGLESLLGERGVRLAASERRRLGIARALVRQPRVLLLDESTTGLDEQAELELLENLRSLRPPMTVILVASQLRSLAGIDRVIELRGGRLAEWPLGTCVETKGKGK